MFILVLIIFSALVIAIGLVTAKLNAKVPCDHHWEEFNNGDLKCTNCFRVIHHGTETLPAITDENESLIKSGTYSPEEADKSTKIFEEAIS
jgi:hypothetical protein